MGFWKWPIMLAQLGLSGAVLLSDEGGTQAHESPELSSDARSCLGKEYCSMFYQEIGPPAHDL